MKVLSKNSVMEFVKKTAILWVMIILILILSVISPSFFRGQNLLNIIKQASITGGNRRRDDICFDHRRD